MKSNPVLGFADNRVNPYIQNFNFEIQRELAKNLTLQTRYIGSKGTRLYGGLSLNDVNIYENGILNAFNITRQGGNAAVIRSDVERNHAQCWNERRGGTRRCGWNDPHRLGGVARQYHLQDVSGQRKCRSVCQPVEYFNDRNQQGRRSVYEERLPGELHRRESAIPAGHRWQ